KNSMLSKRVGPYLPRVLVVHDRPRKLLLVDGTIIRKEAFRVLECPRLERKADEWWGFACRRPHLHVRVLRGVVRGAEPGSVGMLTYKVNMGDKQSIWHESEKP
ncbi:MAG: hypothetical protein ACKPKO_03165, partial [Candidatus Fonsibacter sp.]